MTRSNATARKAGTSFETIVATYLRRWLHDDRIERRARSGAKDRGDIGGVRIVLGGRLVLECKNTTRPTLGPWITEAEIERGNDDATAAVVVHKRVGHGAAGDQYVTMTLRELVTLLTGYRPDDEHVVELPPPPE